MQMLVEWNGKLSLLNEVPLEGRLIAAKKLTLKQLSNDKDSVPNSIVLDNLQTVLFWLKKQDHEGYINHVLALLADKRKYIDEFDDFLSLLDVLPETSYERWIADDQHQWIRFFFNPKRLKTIDFFHALTHKPIAVLRFISKCGLATVLLNIYKPEEQLARIATLSWSQLPEVWPEHSTAHHYLIQLKKFIYFQSAFTASSCHLISLSNNPETMDEEMMSDLTHDKPCYLLFESKIYIVDGALNPIRLMLKNTDPDLSMFPSRKDMREPATMSQLNKIASLTGYTHFSTDDDNRLEDLSKEGSDIEWSIFRAFFIRKTQEIFIKYNIESIFFDLLITNSLIVKSIRHPLADYFSEAKAIEDKRYKANHAFFSNQSTVYSESDFFDMNESDESSVSHTCFQKNPHVVNTPEKLIKVVKYFQKDGLQLILLESLKSQWLEPFNEHMFKAAMATLDLTQPNHYAYFEAIYSTLSFSCSNSVNIIDISEAIEITNWRRSKTNITFKNYLDEKKQNKQLSLSEIIDMLAAIQLFNERHPNNTVENGLELKRVIEKELHLYSLSVNGEQKLSGRRRKDIVDWFQAKLDAYAFANTFEHFDVCNR